METASSDGPRRKYANRAAFTRLDLIVCLATLALLSALGVSSRAKGDTAARTVTCLNNLRQLSQAWLMYADDFKGNFALNAPDVSQRPNWVRGWLDLASSRDNTNTLYLVDGRYALLGPYSRKAELYKCPEDFTSIVIGGATYNRVRSYSMSAAVGVESVNAIWVRSPPHRIYRNMADLTDPSPSRTWVMIEEHPMSINDGFFAFEMPLSPPSTRWIDFPAYYHLGAGALNFADGHAELMQWRDARTRIPYSQPINALPSPNNSDILNLAARTSSRLD
ncbi:MAG: hypothetical protein AB1813_13380 [Verrucomicrobiota bacterium]